MISAGLSTPEIVLCMRAQGSLQTQFSWTPGMPLVMAQTHHYQLSATKTKAKSCVRKYYTGRQHWQALEQQHKFIAIKRGFRSPPVANEKGCIIKAKIWGDRERQVKKRRIQWEHSNRITSPESIKQQNIKKSFFTSPLERCSMERALFKKQDISWVSSPTEQLHQRKKKALCSLPPLRCLRNTTSTRREHPCP